MKLYLQGISDSKEIILENFNQSESIECHRVPLIFSPGSEDGDFVSGRTPWTSGKAGANLRWSQAQRNAEPEQNRTRLRNNWNEASKQDSKQSGFFSGWFCSWKRSGTKNLLISIYQYISCHFCFLKSGAAQLNVNAETRMFFFGYFYLWFACFFNFVACFPFADLILLLLFCFPFLHLLLACFAALNPSSFPTSDFLLLQTIPISKTTLHLKHVKHTRLFVRQAIQAKCTQAPRSFAEFEYLTQQKQQQAVLPEFMSCHAMNRCKILL